MAYIGKTPVIGNFQVCDAISVVNGQAAYTMQVGSVNVSPESANHMLVSLNGILQKPGSSYTVSGSTITFASNLVTGDVIDFIQILGNVLDLGVPSDATVSTAKIVDGAVTSAKLASGTGGKVLQVVNQLYRNTTSTTNTIPLDNTIPQNNEGVEILSVNITPSNTNNKLFITANTFGSVSTSGVAVCLALFQDSTANALASNGFTGGAGGWQINQTLNHFMDAGTTSQTTFKIRIGGHTGTTYINKNGTVGDLYGSSRVSSITIMEIAA